MWAKRALSEEKKGVVSGTTGTTDLHTRGRREEFRKVWKPLWSFLDTTVHSHNDVASFLVVFFFSPS